MHNSHKIWLWVGIFIVVIGFLTMMFFGASPKKMAPLIEKQKALQAQKEKEKQEAAQHQDAVPQEIGEEEIKLPDEQEIEGEIAAEKIIPEQV